jgi:hypothetical protein
LALGAVFGELPACGAKIKPNLLFASWALLLPPIPKIIPFNIEVVLALMAIDNYKFPITALFASPHGRQKVIPIVSADVTPISAHRQLKHKIAVIAGLLLAKTE